MVEEITKTIVRRWKDTGELIAFFPDLPSYDYGYSCSSYMLMEGHGAADYTGLLHITSPVKESDADVQELLVELKRIGYSVKLYKRRTEKMVCALQAEQVRLRNIA